MADSSRSIVWGIRLGIILVTLLLIAGLISVAVSLVRRTRGVVGDRNFDAGPGPYVGHGTHFEAMGTPFGGCGVPPSKTVDDNGAALPFVALNTNSMFAEGANCGRWVEITLQENCVGASNKKWEPCVGGGALLFNPEQYLADDETGKVIYGYTMDSCPDNNFWCRRDDFHLDISEPYLESLNYVGAIWNGRKISWDYLTAAPKGWVMKEPKFMWMTSSKWIASDGSFWAVLIIYNVADGFSKDGEEWAEVSMLTHLGNMWVMNKPTSDTPRLITVRITSHGGIVYGIYEVSFTCHDECKEDPGLDAPATKIQSATCSLDADTCQKV